MTVVKSQAQQSSFAKILFAPAFQGKTEQQLQDLPGTAAGGKYIAAYRQNLEAVNQQLEAVTAAGWELVHVSSTDRGATYFIAANLSPTDRVAEKRGIATAALVRRLLLDEARRLGAE